jgi:hypothetical protein
MNRKCSPPAGFSLVVSRNLAKSQTGWLGDAVLIAPLRKPSLSSLVALAVAEALTIGTPDTEVELLDVLVLAQSLGLAVHHDAAVFENIAMCRES